MHFKLLDLLKSTNSFFVILTVFLIARFGYEFGTGDSAEFIPFILKLHNSNLYRHDLFVNSMNQMYVNERTFFMYFFYPTFINPEWCFWILFLINTFLVIKGLYHIYQYIINSQFIAYCLLILTLFPIGDIEIGAITIHHNSFQGASIATCLAIWSFYFILIKGVNFLSTILLICASFFHPIVGFQAFSLIYGGYFLNQLIDKKIIFSEYLHLLLYVLTAGIWILLIINFQNNKICQLSDIEFINYTYKYYLDIHFDPSLFSKKGYVLLVPSLIAGMIISLKSERYLFIIMTIYLIGVILYLYGFYSNNYYLISSWWFRSNIWIKIIAFPLIIKFLQPYFFKIKFNRYLTLLFLSFIILVDVFLNSNKVMNNPYHFPFSQYKNINDEISFAIQIGKHTPIDAIIIHPIDMTAIKYYALRSSWVEFPRIVRDKCDIKLWYSRIQMLYNLPHTVNIGRNTSYVYNSNNFYHNFVQTNSKLLSKNSNTYCVLYKPLLADNQLVCHNSKYFLYKLP
ncbi:MAG: hypothetical protein SFY32_16230 [Bacteroidota bacterium]|nr:hypothetical protein [Bacteroidota bacterium]